MDMSDLNILQRMHCLKPSAVAVVRESIEYPDIKGEVRFCRLKDGVLVKAQIYGLPDKEGTNGVFAFHIHSGESCSGNTEDPFADALTHYNPQGKEHPYHAGDMPPLFSNSGYALSVFYTDRFKIDDIKGKTVIIHCGVDDFTSQPAGNAGKKIACGKIS